MNNLDTATILLVDDNRADIGLLKESLNLLKLDINLHVISTGYNVLDFIQRKGMYQNIYKPDLIILDINLPGKNGFEILEEIRMVNSSEDLPVIILTTSQQEEDVILARELGANELFVKPSDFWEFNSLVKSILVKYLKNKINIT